MPSECITLWREHFRLTAARAHAAYLLISPAVTWKAAPVPGWGGSRGCEGGEQGGVDGEGEVSFMQLLISNQPPAKRTFEIIHGFL